MTMAFSNFNLKIPKLSVSCPKCKYYLILHETFHIEKFEGAGFENGNSVLKIPAKYTQIPNFL